MIAQEIIDALYDKVLESMQGMIMLWSGSIANIPDGWALCDGDNGTPDLRDTFVVAARLDVAGRAASQIGPPPGYEGGSVNHVHAFDSYSHSHRSQGPYQVDGGVQHYVWDFEPPGTYTAGEMASGTTYDQALAAVPWYALAYIMKL